MKHGKYYYELLAVYNILLYAISWMIGLALIQHAVFFYSWPPDISRYVDVHPMNYSALAAALFVLFKLLHWVEVKSEVELRLQREKEL